MALACLRLPVDYDKGLDVVDCRTGEVLAWRGTPQSAYEVAEQLNATYPPGTVPPAYDTLVHEIVGWRIAGVAG